MKTDMIPSRVRNFNALKRVLDLATIFVLSPLIALSLGLTAVIVLIGLGRPVIFRQRRIGQWEQTFAVFKFRTMTNERGLDGELLADGERLPHLGRVLRALSVDELPQLLNVFRGEMSLIGPRPLLVRYLQHYKEHERMRHWVRPGITGLAQVTGRNSALWDQRLALDAEYVNSSSIRLDAKILMSTVHQVLRRDGVSVIAGESGEPLDVLRSYPSTEVVALRRFEPSDISHRVRWMKNDLLRRHMSIAGEVTESSTVDWLVSIRRDPKRHDFTIYSTDTFECLAMVGLRLSGAETLPELYVFVDPERHNEGLGRVSLDLLFKWMAATTAYAGCRLTVSSQNVAALRLYESFGFVRSRGSEDERVTMELTVSGWNSNARSDD